jgi:hypothetical protein
MKDALNSQSFRYLNEHWSIVDEDCLRGLHLSYVQSKPEDVHVRLANVNEARGNEAIDKPIQFEPLNSMCIQLSPFVADDGYLHPQPELELGNQLDHLRERFRLRKHEAPKLITGEWPFLVEDDETQIF